MEYKNELKDFDFSSMKKELDTKIEDQRTVDQNRERISGLLTNFIARVSKR
ncbi:MAG: hypothetical protein ACXAE3_07510 [Candidatus Kariarchaeaceae archaeon]|jgi:hypothetical protein